MRQAVGHGTSRVVFVRPGRAPLTHEEYEGLELLSRATEAEGREPWVVVDVRQPIHVQVTGAVVSRLLDSSSELEQRWAQRDPRNIAMGLGGGLGERLTHLVENLGLTADDVIVMTTATLFEFDALWDFFLTTGVDRPRVHVHLSGVLPDSVQSLKTPLPTLVAHYRSRLDLFGLFVAKTLTVSTSSDEISGLFAAEGLACEPISGFSLAQVSTDWAEPVERPFVVHVAPAWAGQGASQVFESQLRYVDLRGFGSLVLHVSPTDLGPADSIEHRALLAAGLPAFHATHRWLLVREDPEERAKGLLQPYELPYLSFEGESRAARSISIPRDLQAALKHRTVEWVLVNYAQLVPLVPALGLDDVPLITETIDIRPVQHALNNGGDVQELDLEFERRQWSRSDGVVFINENERQSFLEHDDHPATVTAFPFADIEDRTATPDPFVTRASSLLQSGCALSHPDLALRLVDELALGRDDGEIRTLYVASNHRANVDSLNWYLEHVHLAHFADKPVRLLVAGSIGSAFAGNPVPGVDFLGRVEDLGQLYDLVDVVVLPIVEGTGLPTKMIDAMNRDALFVAVSGALDPVPELAAAIDAYDDPSDFAARVLQLANDQDAAADFRTKLAQVRQKVGSWRRYVETWDEVTKGAGIDSPQNAMPAARDPWPSEAVDVSWTLGGVLAPSVAAVGAIGLSVAGGQVSVSGPYARLVLDASGAHESIIELEFYNPSDVERTVEWFCGGASLSASVLSSSAVSTVRLQVSALPMDERSVFILEMLETRAATELAATFPLALKQVAVL